MTLPSTRTVTRVGAFALLVLTSCAAYAYQEELKTAIRIVLESKWTIAGVSIYVVCCALMYQIFVGGNSEFRGIIHTHFGKYADVVFALVTFVPASATSLALLKGLFMQYFFRQPHFAGFDGIDLTSMAVVSSFLLYHSLFNATKMLIAAISQADSVKISNVNEAA